MAEPRYLDITPENFRRTNTGAGKGDMRGSTLHAKTREYEAQYEKVNWNDPSYEEWLKSTKES